MTSSATEEYNIGVFRSQISLGNPRKERKNKRLCSSEPFFKPLMSQKLMKSIQSSFAEFTLQFFQYSFKKPQNDPQKAGSSIVESVTFLGVAECCRVLQSLQCLREEEPIMPDHSHKPTDTTQMSKTSKSLGFLKPKNKSKSKHSVKSDNKSIKEDGSIPKKEWKNLTKPEANVILDPNTANPSLKLSSDGRSVRTKTHSEFHSNQSYDDYQRKSKHQYNGWTCVQATEGYSKGRHYWEVDVKGKREWRIGVVKESAPRNGFINLNTATGYWTLRLQLGCVMALTVPVTKLNLAPPSKIGILLDYEEGQVTFCDAVNRKHIYTFKEEFRETVFPVFGTVETDIPLRII